MAHDLDNFAWVLAACCNEDGDERGLVCDICHEGIGSCLINVTDTLRLLRLHNRFRHGAGPGAGRQWADGTPAPAH